MSRKTMEKVFDLHVHYRFDIPLPEMVDIFREEFAATGTEKECFLSLPHYTQGDHVIFDEMQNLKGLYLKWAFSPNAYAFAGLEHPIDHNDEKTVADLFLSQAKEYLSAGFDGIKMLDGYPSLVKCWNLPVDSPVYDKFYAFMQENGYPILMHIANPKECWDIANAKPHLTQQGRVYDNTYPTKEELTEQVFHVMEKFPNLRLILAHFGFMSHSVAEAERFLSYPNTLFDIAPGGEQILHMQKNWGEWLPFWEKYADRIFYGTDFYAFPKDEQWEICFRRRPDFLRQILETDGEHTYLEQPFKGVKLDPSLRDKIYRQNFLRLLGQPKSIDFAFIITHAKRLQTVDNKFSTNADNDLSYILSQLPKTE